MDVEPKQPSNTDGENFSRLFYRLSYTTKLPLPNPELKLRMLCPRCSNLLFKQCKVRYFAPNDQTKEDPRANPNLHCDSQSRSFLQYLYACSTSCSSTDFSASIHRVPPPYNMQKSSLTDQDSRTQFSEEGGTRQTKIRFCHYPDALRRWLRFCLNNASGSRTLRKKCSLPFTATCKPHSGHIITAHTFHQRYQPQRHDVIERRN